MNNLLPGVPYIYGREASPNEKVFTLATVEMLCKEIKKLQDQVVLSGAVKERILRQVYKKDEV